MPARSMLCVVLLCLLTVATAAVAAEQKRYVSDTLRINMRTGPSIQNRIVRMLPTGDGVTVLKEDKDSGYSKVRTKTGTVGWVLSRQLSDNPSAKNQLSAAQRTVAMLEQQNQSIAGQLQELREVHDETTRERQALLVENQRLSSELASIQQTASRSLQIVDQNEELKAGVQGLELDLQALRKERDELKDGSARDWFLVGAGVILLGIIVGLILPRLHFRRRTSSWDSF